MALAVHHFTKGTISFQNVGSKFAQRLAREFTRKATAGKETSVRPALPIRADELTHTIHVMCLGSEQTLLVSGSFLSGLD